MAGIKKLTLAGIARISSPGRYGDGGGLYLQVSQRLSKSWVFRYCRGGKERNMGLGPLHTVGLGEAREAARKARVLLFGGIDPMQAKHGDVDRKDSDKTFDECAIEYIASHQAAWRNKKHRKQWETTLRTYASPHFGNTHVRDIDTLLVLKVVAPIWASKTETASRVRKRIERILSWAATMGYRKGDNPARWHGHLEDLLPHPSRLKKVRHHPSMPYEEISAFYRRLAVEQGVVAKALRLTILSACRTSEVLLARWDEIDFANRVWIVPGKRTKNGREHRIPLAGETLEILRSLVGWNSTWVFPGLKEGKPLSNATMLKLLRRMDCKGVTVHGFRASFRTWAAERTHYPREVVEQALAHAVGTEVEAAYQRSDLFEQRQALMRDWGAWCTCAKTESAL